MSRDFSFITRQRGMFSYTGLTAAQVDRLREEHGVYAVSTGRICLAALNSRNLDRVSVSCLPLMSTGASRFLRTLSSVGF